MLGPIFFLIFINGMVQSVNDVFCKHFADDAILYAIANVLCKVNETLQRNVDSFSEWHRQHRLGVYSSKTVVVLFNAKSYLTTYSLWLAMHELSLLLNYQVYG